MRPQERFVYLQERFVHSLGAQARDKPTACRTDYDKWQIGDDIEQIRNAEHVAVVGKGMIGTWLRPKRQAEHQAE